MRKSIILTSIFVCLFQLNASYAQSSKGIVTLQGKLINFGSRTDVGDISELQYLQPTPADRMIEADSNGLFKIAFALKAPGYFRIGRNILYLTPGDNMEVNLDKDHFLQSTFKGKGSEANMYLRNTPFPKAGSYLEAAKNLKPTVQETSAIIEQLANDRKAVLDQVTGVSKEFIRLENARIKADVINSYGSIAVYSAMTKKPRIAADKSAAFMDSLSAITKPYIEKMVGGFVDASLLQLVVYRDIIEYLPLEESKSNAAAVRQIRDWEKASGISATLKETNDKSKIAHFKNAIDSLHTKAYRDALTLSMNAKLKFGAGDTAIDFTANNTAGNKVNLSSLKGKLIYVDIWATWCGPCMEEMPNLEKLKQQYATNTDIAIVSLSIDDSDGPWLKSLNSRKPDGIQWRINRAEMPAYEIETIPRYLLIDKNFKVIDLNATKPSAPETRKMLDDLLKKK